MMRSYYLDGPNSIIKNEQGLLTIRLVAREVNDTPGSHTLVVTDRELELLVEQAKQ